MKKTTLIASALICAAPSVSAREGHSEVKSYLEQAFSAAIVMTDSDVLTLGVHDFDPNEWLNIDNENLGSADSIDLRQRFAVSAMPFTIDLSDEEAVNKSQLFFRLSALVSRQDVVIRGVEEDDKQREMVLGAFSAYRYQYHIDSEWQVTPGLGVHLQYFRNEHNYNSAESNQYVKPALDGVVFNTSAWAATLEPHVELKYNRERDWGSWNATSSVHYFYGRGWGEANYGDVGNPHGWYVANGLEAFYNMTKWGRSVQSLYSSIKRIDLGGDTEEPMGTNYYYETSVGWLMTPPFKSSWIDNIGIGFNLNYGSRLKGGSIVLFFNQD